jgi:hypothetical protein
MKKSIAAICVLSLLNLAALQAGPIEKKETFSSAEIVALSHQQLASMEDVREVEAGLFGATSALVNLALYGATLYGGYLLSDAITGD